MPCNQATRCEFLKAPSLATGAVVCAVDPDGVLIELVQKKENEP